MSAVEDLSVTLITLNEEKNIARAIQSVQSLASEIIVVDSGSTDRTREVAESLGARVVENAWQGYGQQKNFAQRLATKAWVLNLDADEEVSPALAQEIRRVIAREGNAARSSGARAAGAVAFAMPRKTFFGTRWIRRGGWYPNHVTRLARREDSRWTEPALHEVLRVEGRIEKLREPLNHYTFDGVSAQVRTNLRYAQEGARQFLADGGRPTLARLLLKPLGKFFESYVFKRGFLDGLPGFLIAVNAAHSMFLKYAIAREYESTRSR